MRDIELPVGVAGQAVAARVVVRAGAEDPGGAKAGNAGRGARRSSLTQDPRIAFTRNPGGEAAASGTS